MALSGMTGFARSDGVAGGRRWAWEARSVNGRGLDVKTRLPQGFEALEPSVREAAGKRFRRGSLQISLNIVRDAEAGTAARLDVAFLDRLLADAAGHIRAGRIDTPRLDGLLQVRGVLVSEDLLDDAAVRADLDTALSAGLVSVLEGLSAARGQEGRVLAGVFAGLIDAIEAGVRAARGLAALAPAALAERLSERVMALAPAVLVDPARLAQEAALLASKADVQEELERLAAHAAEARALIAGADSAGRRLEFLAQELNREANTLCSKSSDLALTRIGLDLKTAIDQFREQAANAE